MPSLFRRLRSSYGIGSARMKIRSQLAWQWRWLLNLLMMAAAGAIVWWLVSGRLGGQDIDQMRQRVDVLTEENAALKHNLDGTRGTLAERERQLQIEKAAQGELGRNVAQLQEENAALKDDLGFLRKLMSSGGATPEGVGVSDLRVERDGAGNAFTYHLLLTQGGQRKQDFKGRVQLLAHVAEPGGAQSTLSFPDASAPAGALDFRFYQKVEGRFTVPEGATLKSVDVRVVALPGGQVKLSRTVNFP
jgi:regulator of replication initiation timing